MISDQDDAELINRLRGIVNIPINDGYGPIDGSMVFTRRFTGQPQIQLDAATMIELLEAGGRVEVSEIDNMISALERPDFYMNMPTAYVPPIHSRAANRLRELRTDNNQ